MSEEQAATTVYAGAHLSMVSHDGWEYITRNTQRPAVGIVAITNDDEVVLVEQTRKPVECNVLELPAGLAGDISGSEDEPLVEAAKRELLEETGYTAARWTRLSEAFTSPGLTDESIVLFLAEALEKQHAGGGDESEQITVHQIPRDRLWTWLREQQTPLDLKLLAALFAAEQELKSRR